MCYRHDVLPRARRPRRARGGRLRTYIDACTGDVAPSVDRGKRGEAREGSSFQADSSTQAKGFGIEVEEERRVTCTGPAR